jgi:CubicO group peptidase (beta-lactamase class C family)
MTGDARRVVDGAIGARVFAAAAIEVGASDRVLWRDALGTLTFEEGAPPATIDTIFDLASLTKPIATTTVIMQLMSNGAVRLDEPVRSAFDDWRGEDREGVTVRDLLEHSSGLPARLVDPPGETRREFEHDICTIRLEYPPRAKSIYSDLGFILLAFLTADRGGASLAEQFGEINNRLQSDGVSRGSGLLQFAVATGDRGRTAPTMPLDEDRRRGTLLVGEVHDNYAAALGGVAGHAGLFGTAGGVGAFGRAVLRAARGDASAPPPLSPALVGVFTTKSAVPGSSRALGWDRMLPTSSCGTRMSASAFGHVGFTGTSLWIDPARDRYFVLLTNRVCGGGSVDDMRDVRRAFHDALGDF